MPAELQPSRTLTVLQRCCTSRLNILSGRCRGTALLVEMSFTTVHRCFFRGIHLTAVGGLEDVEDDS